MKKLHQLIVYLLTVAWLGSAFAQMDTPDVQAVYGGRINAISGFARTPDTSRIFVSTESANSIFYADVAATVSPSDFGWFTVMPAVGAADGYGANIRSLAAHDSSGKVFFIHQSALLSSHPDSTTVNVIHSGNVHALTIYESTVYYANEIYLYYGELDNDGFFKTAPDSISWTSVGSPKHIGINPVDSLIYVYAGDGTPLLHVSTEKYTELTNTTVFNDISPTLLSSTVDWRAFGIGPDGRLLLGGSDGANKHFAYSENATSWTSYATSLSGVAGDNIVVSGDSSAYCVYFAKGYNTNKGESGAWSEFGQPGGFETHPNDGAVFTDPVNSNIVYMTTDQGLGASTDKGETIFEINNGIEAVQVNDFDMTEDKDTGWLASKSGIRRVDDFLTSPAWTNAMFPNGDGSPYYSVDIESADAEIVYVGNLRIYKTSNNGSTWSQVFTPENAPYNFSNFGTKVSAIEVCQFDTAIVFAGFEIAGSDKGGLFYSEDYGSTWNQLLIEVSTNGQDVDVFDIVFNEESGDTVAYVGVEYDLASPQGRSVYKITKSGSSWNVVQDMSSSGTSSGSSIVVTIRDLQVSTTGDTIYACGTDAGVNHPTAYWKPFNADGLWSSMGSSGFPTNGEEAYAITIGRDTVYCAVENAIYYRPVTASSWTMGFAYPVGQRINVLYFDDLLVGTGTGLYGHDGSGFVSSVEEVSASVVPSGFVLEQNYPNPFNPATIISYKLPSDSKVKIAVFNLLGREVAVLVNAWQTAGSYQIRFDARNLPNGVYFYKILARDFTATRKMLLLK